MINIKDTANNIRFSTEINTGSKRKFSLMSEDYITLKFSVEEPIYFKLGDYADTELGLFELVDPYKPTLNESTGGYDYELRLDAYYWKWKNKMFRFNPEVGGSEASWKLTSTLDVHLGVFLRNLTALGYTYKGTPFEIKIDSTVSNTSKLVIYENINLIDALSQMAETWECEWWVEDNQICFGRCEFGDPVDFEIFENVENMTREESKTTYATRVYAFGSTRNIPNNYRPVDESVVVNGIVQKRLMMPVGVPYVDAYPDMTTEEAIEDVVVFEDIYPRRTGTMSSVTPVERTENVENEDGSTTQQKYTVYQFKDTGITFSKDYILPGEELRIVFQTGAMAGMDFAVTFNPDNLPEKLENGNWNPEAQLWEIVRNEDYGRMLPADTLIPKNGDTYNLYGFDSTSEVFNDMVSRAEEELEEAAKKYVEKTKIDPNTYPCTMMSDYMYNNGNVRTNEFTVGARINLINPAYFENGRVSRVIGFEFDLDIPYSSPVFTIGETAGYSRIGDLEEKVDELTYKGQTFTGTGSGVYVIGTNDNTSPTNKNVYSALKVLREFVRYQGWVDQPVRSIDDVRFKSVTQTEDNWHITDKGDAKLRDIIGRVITITDRLMTDNFVAGMTGVGVGVVNKAEVHMDKGVIRKYLEVLALVVAQIFYRGGRQVLSPAGMKINRVEEFDGYYRCYMETEDGQVNQFTVGAQARCNRYGSQQRYWWRLVDAIGVDYIDVSKTDMDAGSMAPAVGDEVVQFGHRTDPYLQWVVMDSSFSDDAGRTIYAGVNSYDLSGKWVLREGVGPDDPTKIGLFTPTGEFSEIIEGLGQDIQDAQTSASDADRKAQEIQDYIDNALRNELDGLHDQADGLVERWPGDYIPLPNNENPTSEANYPANQWTTEEEKQKHVDDTFTKDSGSSEYLGNSWKWSKVNGVWQWVLISDTALTAALAQSARAEETANRKTRNFIVTPYPPYEAGDTWSQGASGDYMRCVKSRESGSFVESDWEKASKYTDDTKANEALERTRIMADDGIISKEEKATLRDTLAQIKEEITTYQEQATVYGVSINDLLNAYNTLNTFLVNTAKINESGFDTALTVAKKTEYNQAFANYYSERTEFANIVSQKIADGAVGNIQFGMVNLLKGSNVELGAQKYDIGRYYFDKKPEVGKTYTLVACYTIGVNNTHIGAYQDYGVSLISNFTTKGNKVVETRTFKYSSTRSEEFMTFYQFPQGTYGSKVHWAVLVEGNKGPSGWVPALSEQGEEAARDAIDNLQIGSVNLVSRKMMLAWNEKNKDIAVWGQDSDGIYLGINQGLLYSYVGGEQAGNDIFNGAIKFKANTQYIISVEWKLSSAMDDVGLFFIFKYTDGTSTSIYIAKNQTTKVRQDLISEKGKTISKVICTYGINTAKTITYSLAIYEGNKVLTEIPVATEDLQGQSNVNLLDNSKFQFGTEGYAPNQTASLNVVGGVLQVRSSQTTSSPGVRFPLVHLKPGVYTVKVNTKGVNVPSCSILVYNGDMSSMIIRTGYLPVLSTFTEKLLTFAISTEGDYLVLMTWNATLVTAYPAGIDIEYSMLVEGFTPPASYSPSQGDIDQSIQDAIAKTVSITAPSQVFKYGAGYTGTPTPSSIVLTANPKNFTPTSYQWQYLNGSTWTNISGATSSTYSVAPGNTTLFPSGTNVRTFRCVCNGDEKLSDIFTLAKLADGATGSPGEDGKDAYTILLTNEAHAFAGSTDAALAGSTTCGVIAYKGAGQVAVTIGTITGLPAGMTASIASNGTTAPVITFTVTTSMKTASGTVSIPVTVDGKSFTRVFSYSIAFKGTTGETGAAGKGVKSTTITYQASSSGTTTPTGTWSSSIPAVAAGQYLWTRTIITYTDNTTSTMYSVGRMGTNGTDGNAGNGVSSTTITYQASTSGTTAPTGTWSSSIPSVAAGSYLWTRTIISYTNGTSSTIYSVGKIGEQGIPGESINGKMLYKDPEFKVGLNGTKTYGAQNGGGTVVINRIRKSTGQDASNSFSADMATHVKNEASGSPYSESDWCLYIKAYGGGSTSHLGGFMFGNQSRANAVFIVKVSAKIPVGYTLKNAHNSHGTSYKQELLTSMAGTGKYETYIFKETCGSTGTFSTVNYLYLSGPVKTGSDPLDENPDNRPLEWFVDYATVMDQTADGYADIEIVTKDSFAEQLGFTDFEALKANAVKPGNGPLIEAGLVNTKLLTAEALLAVDGFVDKLRTNILTADSIKANMLSVAGFTFQDNQIYGGSDYGVGSGVKITSKDAERSFKAYKDASNYISMFYNSASDWGLKGVVGGSTLLQLGVQNIISGWKIGSTGFEGGTFQYPTISGSVGDYSVSGGSGSKLFPDGGIMLIPTGTGILPSSSGIMQAGLIKATGSNAYIMGLEIIAHNNSGYGSLAQVTALKLSAINDYASPSKNPAAIEISSGDINISNGGINMKTTWSNLSMQNYSYIVGGCGQVPTSILQTGSTNRFLEPDQTVVLVNNSQHFNVFLPDARNLKPGHTVKFIPFQSSYSHGIIADSGNYNAKIRYKNNLYDWIQVNSVSGGRVVIIECTYIGVFGGYRNWVAGVMNQDGISYGNN